VLTWGPPLMIDEPSPHTPIIFAINFNIFWLSPRPFVWSLSLRFPANMSDAFFPPPACHMPCPFHTTWFFCCPNIDDVCELWTFIMPSPQPPVLSLMSR
jgi:hypothetical protein